MNRIFNLTDVTTPKLAQHKMFQQSLVLAGALVKPGDFVDTEMGREHPSLIHPLKTGAVAVNDPPQYYFDGKAKMKAVPALVADKDKALSVQALSPLVPSIDAAPLSKRSK
jgi:hypothetical protein